jgi:membrane protein
LWEVATRVTDKLQAHNSALLAAGIAMYGLLSVFPGLAAAVFVYGLFATPADVSRQMAIFAGILPPGAWEIFRAQLQNVAEHDRGALTVAAALGLFVALWSARLTMSALMSATNIAHEVPERRGFFYQILISLVLTIGAIVGFIAMLLVGVIVPVVLAVFGTSAWVQETIAIVRWVVLWVFAVIGLALVYYYAPARRRTRLHCLTWGSTVAATFWVALSALFGLYVRSVGSYDETYGALAGVIVLLVWFYLLSFTVVLGAEVNAAMEARRAERLHPTR